MKYLFQSITRDTLIQVPSSNFRQVPSSKFRQVPQSSEFRLFQVPNSQVPSLLLLYWILFNSTQLLLSFTEYILYNGFMLRKSRNRNVLCLIATLRRCYLKFYSPVQSWVVTVNDLLLEYGLPWGAYHLHMNCLLIHHLNGGRK